MKRPTPHPLYKDMPEHVQDLHNEARKRKRTEERRLWKEKHSVPVDQSSVGPRFTR